MTQHDRPSSGVTHVLKAWPEYFQAVLDGRKTFEVRKNDRSFQVGDLLVLREFRPPTGAPGDAGEYTGCVIDVTVTYLLAEPSPFAFPGYVVIGFQPYDRSAVTGAMTNHPEPSAERIAEIRHKLSEWNGPLGDAIRDLQRALDARTAERDLYLGHAQTLGASCEKLRDRIEAAEAKLAQPDYIAAMIRGAQKSGASARLSFHDYKCMADEIITAPAEPKREPSCARGECSHPDHVFARTGRWPDTAGKDA